MKKLQQLITPLNVEVKWATVFANCKLGLPCKAKDKRRQEPRSSVLAPGLCLKLREEEG